jgi:hypothetical protein
MHDAGANRADTSLTGDAAEANAEELFGNPNWTSDR